MKIYLIRHGQTTGDIEDRFGGDYDDHLTELGKTQAKELANKLQNLGIKRIYHSSRVRAVETAKIVNEITNISLEEDIELRERNAYGILTGKIKFEVKEKYPKTNRRTKKPKSYNRGRGTL